MFPTFLSFTQRHPRAAAVIGLNIFILVAVLLITVSRNKDEFQSSIVDPQSVPSQDEIIIGDTFSHEYPHRYDFQNVTYNMTGNIRKIEGDVLTLEDTTPKYETESTPTELIKVTVSEECVLAYGHEFVEINAFKVGDNIFLKTVQNDDGFVVAQEIFKGETSSLPAEIY